MWPDILNDLRSQIVQRLAQGDETALVYLGASATVPTVSQVNIARGNTERSGEPTYCESYEEEFTVYIELWASEEIESNDLNNEDFENARTLASYKKIAAMSELIRATDFTSAEFDYTASLKNIESDGDSFRPTCGERIKYLVERGVS